MRISTFESSLFHFRQLLGSESVLFATVEEIQQLCRRLFLNNLKSYARKLQERVRIKKSVFPLNLCQFINFCVFCMYDGCVALNVYWKPDARSTKCPNMKLCAISHSYRPIKDIETISYILILAFGFHSFRLWIVKELIKYEILFRNITQMTQAMILGLVHTCILLKGDKQASWTL